MSAEKRKIMSDPKKSDMEICNGAYDEDEYGNQARAYDEFQNHFDPAKVKEMLDEIEYLKSGFIHTCHDECQKPPCVKLREKDARIVELEKWESDFHTETLANVKQIKSLQSQRDRAIEVIKDSNQALLHTVRLGFAGGLALDAVTKTSEFLKSLEEK